MRVEPHRLSRRRFPLMYDSTNKDPKAKSACPSALSQEESSLELNRCPCLVLWFHKSHRIPFASGASLGRRLLTQTRPTAVDSRRYMTSCACRQTVLIINCCCKSHKNPQSDFTWQCTSFQGSLRRLAAPDCLAAADPYFYDHHFLSATRTVAHRKEYNDIGDHNCSHLLPHPHNDHCWIASRRV